GRSTASTSPDCISSAAWTCDTAKTSPRVRRPLWSKLSSARTLTCPNLSEKEGGWPRPPPLDTPPLSMGSGTGRARQVGELALHEALGAEDRHGRPLFAPDGDHVLDEVVAILQRHHHLDILPIPALRTVLEGADQEVAWIHRLGLRDRQAPQGGHQQGARIGHQVLVLSVLGQLYGRPVERVEHVAV